MKDKYTVSYPRLFGLLGCLIVYGAISLYGSVGLTTNLQMAIAIQLSLSVVTFVLVLFALWKPIQKLPVQTVEPKSDLPDDFTAKGISGTHRL